MFLVFNDITKLQINFNAVMTIRGRGRNYLLVEDQGHLAVASASLDLPAENKNKNQLISF